MRKIFLTFAVISLISLTACKEEKKTTDSTTNATAQEENVPIAGEGVEANTDIPKFSDPEVQKLVDDYDAYVKEYISVAKSGDVAKLTTLTQKGQEWGAKTAEAMNKLTSNPENLKKFNEHIQKLVQEMQTAVSGK